MRHHAPPRSHTRGHRPRDNGERLPRRRGAPQGQPAHLAEIAEPIKEVGEHRMEKETFGDRFEVMAATPMECRSSITHFEVDPIAVPVFGTDGDGGPHRRFGDPTEMAELVRQGCSAST